MARGEVRAERRSFDCKSLTALCVTYWLDKRLAAWRITESRRRPRSLVSV